MMKKDYASYLSLSYYQTNVSYLHHKKRVLKKSA